MQPKRLFYSHGPGDIIGTYRHFERNDDDPHEISIAFSSLVFDYCRSLGLDSHFIAWFNRVDAIKSGKFTIKMGPKPAYRERGGIPYHFSELVYGSKLISDAIRHRSDVAVVDSGSTHWFLLSALALWNIPVIAVFHSTLWPTGHRPTHLLSRVLDKLNGWYFRNLLGAAVCVSPECERQVLELAGRMKGRIYQCRAQFRAAPFERIAPATDLAGRPFRVVYVGRIERDKGVFDLLATAERLSKEAPGKFEFRFCGGGGALEELRAKVSELGLDACVAVEGRVSRERIFESYSWCDASSVPTTGTYGEGLAMTAAEAALAGRPVVLTEVVPAGEILGDAAVRVNSGDIDDFCRAFRLLSEDSEFYDSCRKASVAVRTQFLTHELGLGAVIGQAVSNL